MSTYTKQLLSGSTNGKQIGINTGTPPGVTVHTAVSGIEALDEIWVYAINNGTSTLPVTICWGGTTATDIATTNVAPGQGPTLLTDGQLLQNGNVVSCYVSGIYATAITLEGFINRIQ